jgi:hypothetical protein
VRSGDDAGRDDGFSSLVAGLTAAFSETPDGAWPDERFDRLALRVFAWQFGANSTYRRFAEARGRTPSSLTSWREVPAVPAAAFKHLPLISGAPDSVERVFRTSGTTAGGRRGTHHVRSLELYRASLLPTFRARILPDGAVLPFLSLIPSPERQSDSSLSTMVGAAMDAFGAPESVWLADPERGLDLAGFSRALAASESAAQPVLVLGTAFAFVHWLDALGARGGEAQSFRLPLGSRVLETGGFKGRSRAVARDELYGALAARLGVGPEWIVNEYGMTELLSQYYEADLGRAPAEDGPLGEALAARRLVPPPWLRFRILDPVTLAPLAPGEPGLVAHFDLANAGSVSAVLTEDMGIQDGGLRLLGRTPGAEPRGCSVAMDELLSAADGP